MNGHAAVDYINGHGALPDSPASGSTPTSGPVAPVSKKTKAKKPVDDNEKAKLVAARLNQLELGAAEEKDQELEIEREVRKATRDMTNLLAGIANPLERMDALQKRNTDLFAEMKKLERDHLKAKKRADQLQKEKDASRSELTKVVGMKDRLEKLCRTLTSENKKMKVVHEADFVSSSQEEHKRLEDTEKKSRDLISERGESIFWDIGEIMDQKEKPGTLQLDMETEELYVYILNSNNGHEARSRVQSANSMSSRFKTKFKSLIEQYELRELHFLSLQRTKECELHTHLARCEQQRKVAENEAARSRQLSAQVSTFSQTETELRSQLNIYVEKFKQVEDTLNNSNDLFLTFRKEMEEMSKKTKRLEKENLNLTRKHDLTNKNILEMAEDRARLTEDMEILRKKNTTLESVIRRMQDQGRAPAVGTAIEGDEEGTESEYDDEDYDEEEGSEEVEYDDDTEEELAFQTTASGLPAFGPVPPPPTVNQALVNGKVNGIKQ
ncbi:hypothetical protein MMC11_000276 [Xylographa trunciseda]|nr:hypothetical protein [Xylographa trunciseda]